MNNAITVAPSLLASDWSSIKDEVENATRAGADWLHVDVMDGHFVPPITLGAQFIRTVKKHTTVPLDVHLMVSRPEDHVADARAAGADVITIHAEATPHIHRLLKEIRDLGAKAGLAFNPATPVDTLEHVLDVVDLVLVMTINPGWGGQPFLPACLEKIRHVRSVVDRAGRPIHVEVDGGINAETARQCTASGADVLVSGSYVFGSDDYAARIASLRG